MLGFAAVYTLGFWRWKQATPGKLMAGIRIRRRETPGPMPWSTMLPRFLFVQALALATYVPWVGLLFVLAGLLEEDEGRAANLALAALEGFTLTGDLSASDRYYAHDVTEPVVLGPGGRLAVPQGPGLGVDVELAALERRAVPVEVHTRGR